MDSWTRIPEREMDWSKLSVMGGQEGSEEGLCIVYVWLGSFGHFKKKKSLPIKEEYFTADLLTQKQTDSRR